MHLICGVIEGLWRRWFGGGYDIIKNQKSIWYKIVSNRGTQTIFNIAFLFCIFYHGFSTKHNIFSLLPDSWVDFITEHRWGVALYNAAMFQFMFWSKGHGPFFDYGHQKEVSEYWLKRYNQIWFNKYLAKFWDKYMTKWFPKYGFAYDLVGMNIRYFYPLLLVAPTFHFHILILGLIVTAIYAMMWGLYDDNSEWYSDNPNGLRAPTQIAEVLSGFCVGWLLYICKMF